MKARKQAMGLLAAGLLSAVALAGCGSGSTPTASKQSTTITMLALNASNFTAAHRKIIAAFEKLHPNIHVSLETVPYPSMEPKLLADASAGTLPDIIEGNSPMITTLMAGHYLLPLTPTLGALNTIEPKYWPQSIESFVEQGALYAIPGNYNLTVTPVLMYNKKLFQKKHLSASWNTWSQFVATLKQATKYGAGGKVIRAGYEIYPSYAPWAEFLMYYVQYGGKLPTKRGENFDFNVSAGVKALQLLYQLEDVAHVAGPNTGTVGVTTDMIKGISATEYGGVWMIKGQHVSYPTYPISNDGLAIQPVPPGGQERFVTFDKWAWAVSKDTHNKAAAYTFLKFLAQKQSELTWALAAGEIPGRKSLQTAAVQAQPLYKPFYPLLNKGINLALVGSETTFQNTLDDMIGKVVTKGESPTAALAKADSQLQADSITAW